MKIPAEQSAEHYHLGQHSKPLTSGNRHPIEPALTAPHQRQGDRGAHDDDTSFLPRQRVLEEFATEEELAQEFKVTVQTLRRWRRRKVGPPWLRGPGGVLYHIPGSQKWLQNNLVMPQRACR